MDSQSEKYRQNTNNLHSVLEGLLSLWSFVSHLADVQILVAAASVAELRAGVLEEMLSVTALLEPCNPVSRVTSAFWELTFHFRDIPEWNKSTVSVMGLGFRKPHSSNT